MKYYVLQSDELIFYCCDITDRTFQGFLVDSGDYFALSKMASDASARVETFHPYFSRVTCIICENHFLNEQEIILIKSLYKLGGPDSVIAWLDKNGWVDRTNDKKC